MREVEFSVLIPSRGRPSGLIRAIRSMLDRGRVPKGTEIIVGLDEDDEWLGRYREALAEYPDVTVYVSPRFPTLGALYNFLCSKAQGEWIIGFTDDAVIRAHDWQIVARAAAKRRGDTPCVMYLNDPTHPGFSSYLCLSRKTIKEMGFFCAPWFPFWFVDTWWDEIGEMMGRKYCITEMGVEHPDGRGITTSMRDLAFWADVFEKTRPVRISAAAKMAEVQISLDAVRMCAMRVAHLRTPEFVKQWEKTDGSESSERYIEAKAAAEEFVKSIPAQPNAGSPKVLICVPSTGSWHARMASSVSGMMTLSAMHGVTMGLMSLEGSMITKSRNDLVKSAIEHGMDYVLFVDSDLIFPPDALLRLLNHQKDIVGATYNKRVPPYETLGRLLGPKPTVEEYEKGGLYPADLMPGGFMLVRVSVYKELGWPWYFETYQWPGETGLDGFKEMLRHSYPEAPSEEVLSSLDNTPLAAWVNHMKECESAKAWDYFSEDLAFCRKAIKARKEIWCDVGLSFNLVHIGALEVTCKPPTLNQTTDVPSGVPAEKSAEPAPV